MASGITQDEDLNSNGTIDPRFERGRYGLEDVPPGTYTLEEVLQPGWQATAPPSGAYTVTLESGKTIFRVFGNVGGDIHGQKFHDVNLNGVRDNGEVGLNDWTIRLVDADGTEVATQETHDLDLNGDGSIDPETERGLYWFIDVLPPGIYTVEEVAQTGWAPTTPSGGSQSVDLTSNARQEGIDFGNARVGSIHGLKFHDVDGDGLKDANEPIIVSWEIEVRDALTGALVTTVLTMPDDPATAENEAGMYWAEGLAPGTYLVSEVVRPGWEQTLPTPPGIHTVTLGPGQVVRGIDFGNRLQPRSVHGQKFHDANGNGVKDSGEPGLAGWEIEVYDSGVLVGTATTMADDPTTGADETGAYWITWRDVLPSTRTFFVREVLQPNWEQTFPAGVGVPSITLGPGDVIEGIDFGNRETPGSIHVQKFEDLNGDGLKQDNEPGLNDWTITLPDGTRLSELTHTDVLTGEAGWVWFTNLPLGGYIVQEVLQPG